MGNRDNPHVFCTFDVVERKRKAREATPLHLVIPWDVCQPLRICRYTAKSGLHSSEKVPGEIVPGVFFIKTLRRAELVFSFRVERKPLSPRVSCFHLLQDLKSVAA